MAADRWLPSSYFGGSCFKGSDIKSFDIKNHTALRNGLAISLSYPARLD